jgi:HEAT repeat protein
MVATPLLKRIDIFISSPGDVSAERDAIKWAVEFLNRLTFIRNGYLLWPLEYSELVPPEMGQPAQLVVNRYLHEPDQCYLLICVLWQRMGTPFTHPVTKQTYQSGTEYEFTKAYEAHKLRGRPLLLLYRREPADAEDEEQQLKVKAFFERITAAGADLVGLYRQYASLDEFKTLIVQHIKHVLCAHPPGDTAATVQRPALIEEERRLDTAMPKAVRVKQPTELWVQLCVPSSPGFRDQLAEERTSEFELRQDDIGSQSLAVVFPSDTAGVPEPTILHVEVVAPDFEIRSPRVALKVVHGRDSACLLFNLVPTVERAKSIVHVHVKQLMPEGVEVLVTAAALYVKAVSGEVASPIWSLLRSPLRTVRSLMYAGKAGVERDILEERTLPEANWQEYQEMMAVRIPEEIEELVMSLTRENRREARYAAEKIRKFGPLASTACLQALRDTPNAWDIIDALVCLEPGVTPLLLAALSDERATMRGNAALALGRIGSASAGPYLIRALRDPDSGVRSCAASALGSLGLRGDVKAVEALVFALGDRAGEVRSAAAWALGVSWQAGSGRSLQPLIAALQDHEVNVRRATAHALGEIKDTAAVAPLVGCLFDSEVRVRMAASNALGQFGDLAVRAILAAGPEAIESLVGIESAEEFIIWASNGWLLKAIGEPAVAPLIAALQRCRSSSGYGYKRIVGALRSIGTPAALAAVPPGAG